MALALLVARWGRPVAWIVDHGLRPESAAEAALAQDRLAALGVPANILTLRGLRRGAERARDARYNALFAACAGAGQADLLIAQHTQDQAETVQLRRDSGSKGAGLAGMAAIVVRGGVRVVRPLLGVGPDRLRATLRDAGVGWIEDPSNHDLTTPRARLRVARPADHAIGVDGAAAAHDRAVAEAAIATELAALVSLYPAGYAHVHARALSAGAVSALMWTVSGRAHPPGAEAVARFVPLRAGTLHGVIVTGAGRLGPGWLIAREKAAVRGMDDGRWDGRFRRSGGIAGDAAPFEGRRALPALLRARCPAAHGYWFDPSRPAAPAPFVPSGTPWGCTARPSTPCLAVEAASAHTGPGSRSPGSLQPRPEPGEQDWIAGIT